MADITGAFFAGLVVTQITLTSYLNKRFDTLCYILLSPIFFTSIGLQVELAEMSKNIILFLIVLVLVPVAGWGKIVPLYQLPVGKKRRMNQA